MYKAAMFFELREVGFDPWNAAAVVSNLPKSYTQPFHAIFRPFRSLLTGHHAKAPLAYVGERVLFRRFQDGESGGHFQNAF